MNPNFHKMSCPVCGDGIEFPVEGVGVQIPCPHCSTTIELAAPSPKPPPLPSPSAVTWHDPDPLPGERLSPPPTRRAAPLAQNTYPDPDAPIRCPKCHSSQVAANKKGFGLKGAAWGAVLLGPVGLIGGMLGSGKIKITCLKCGNVFQPGSTS